MKKIDKKTETELAQGFAGFDLEGGYGVHPCVPDRPGGHT